jgi:decaprenyl-phosphate phosphoribosyltransferase
MIRVYLRLLRIQQWVKNLFIFLPLFFSLRIVQIELLSQAFNAFIAFCLVSSAVYIFNDLRDIEADRLHPQKSVRPLASGTVSWTIAAIVMVQLLTAGLVISWSLGPPMLSLILLYLILNLAYSLKLKHIPIVDIFIIATGFVIRIFVGGVVTDTKIYMWIVIMTFLLALFIALAKRRNDVIIYLKTNAKVRKVVDGYNLTFIDSAMMVMAAVILVSYIMYTVSPDVVAKFNTDKLYLTSTFVVLGILRYMQITFVENNGGSPTEILFKDRFIQLCLAGWLVTFAILIYHI